MCNRLLSSTIIVSVLCLIDGTTAFPIKVDVGGGPLKPGWIRMSSDFGENGQVTREGATFTASCHLDYEEDWCDYSGGCIGRDYFLCDEECGDPEGRIILTISNLPAVMSSPLIIIMPRAVIAVPLT
jgi:hypothetical protein